MPSAPFIRGATSLFHHELFSFAVAVVPAHAYARFVGQHVVRSAYLPCLWSVGAEREVQLLVPVLSKVYVQKRSPSSRHCSARALMQSSRVNDLPLSVWYMMKLLASQLHHRKELSTAAEISRQSCRTSPTCSPPCVMLQDLTASVCTS